MKFKRLDEKMSDKEKYESIVEILKFYKLKESLARFEKKKKDYADQKYNTEDDACYYAVRYGMPWIDEIKQIMDSGN